MRFGVGGRKLPLNIYFVNQGFQERHFFFGWLVAEVGENLVLRLGGKKTGCRYTYEK